MAAAIRKRKYVELRSPVKEENSRDFGELAAAASTAGPVLILDGPHLKTTRDCVASGCSGDSIVIVERDPAVAYAQRYALDCEELVPSRHVILGDFFAVLGDFLRDDEKVNPPSALYADMMAADLSVKERSVLRLWAQRTNKPGAKRVLAITLTARSRKGASISKRSARLERDLKPHGLSLRESSGYRRSPGSAPMQFLLFVSTGDFEPEYLPRSMRSHYDPEFRWVSWWGYPEEDTEEHVNSDAVRVLICRAEAASVGYV